MFYTQIIVADRSCATVYCAPEPLALSAFVGSRGRYEDRSNNFAFQREHYYPPRCQMVRKAVVKF